jgi:hypothetical protein
MPDTATPIFQTVNSNGEALAVFEAVIKALGFEMVEGVVDGSPPSQIRWVGSGENDNEVIEGFVEKAIHKLIASANWNVTKPLAERGSAELVIEATPGKEAVGINLEQTGGVTQQATLLDSSYNSTFLQLAGGNVNPEEWHCNFGTSLLNFITSTSSQVLYISHGLGTTPIATFALLNEPPYSAMTVWSGLRTATSFALASYSTLGIINGTVAVSWLAIG